MHRQPGHIRSRRVKKAAITPIFVRHPSGSATHFSDLLHAYAAVGFPDDHGELLLATENLQPVIAQKRVLRHVILICRYTFTATPKESIRMITRTHGAIFFASKLLTFDAGHKDRGWAGHQRTAACSSLAHVPHRSWRLTETGSIAWWKGDIVAIMAASPSARQHGHCALKPVACACAAAPPSCPSATPILTPELRVVIVFNLAGVQHFLKALGERDRLDFIDEGFHPGGEVLERLKLRDVHRDQQMAAVTFLVGLVRAVHRGQKPLPVKTPESISTIAARA